MTTAVTDNLRQQIRERLAAGPMIMTLQIARDLGVPEVEVIREMPDGRAVELDIARWQELFEALPALGTVHVIVSNGAATLECEGQFGNFSTWGEFFNVQTKTLDMHIRHPNLGAAFAVEKPSHISGLNTLSLQLYDRDGHSALKVFLTFGSRPPSAEVQAQFDALRDRFRAVAGGGGRR